jgi:carbon-monoxide dehydrogenase medium subunit
LSQTNSDFEYYFPTTEEEASNYALQYGSLARFISGGTDLWLELEQGNSQISALIDITRISTLQNMALRKGRFVIGSAVTFSEILKSTQLESSAPFLIEAIKTIGGVQVRNIATLVGNITNASPAGDSLTPLYALNAQIHIFSPRGSFTVPIEDFIVGVRQTILDEGEFVTHVSFELPDQTWRGKFAKVGLRRAMAIAVVNATVVLCFQQDVVKDARIAIGAVAPTVIRVEKAEHVLTDKKVNEALIEQVATISADTTTPINDIRASARYRRLAVRGLIRRALNEIFNETMARE